jgi:hypothetical protein
MHSSRTFKKVYENKKKGTNKFHNIVRKRINSEND